MSLTKNIRKMKIAHVVWTLLTGGIETMLVNIINEQVKTEDVTLFIVNDRYYPPLIEHISPKCKVIYCNRKPGSRNPFPFLRLNYVLWKISPDVVHVHTYKLSDIIWDRRKIVRTIHNTQNQSREYPRMKALYSISEAVAGNTLKQGFASVVVENGVLADKIRKKTDYTVKNRTFHFVQVSRLKISQKGQDIFISAINELVNVRNIRNFQVHFIGDGESRPMLEEMVQKFHLEDYVIFEGTKPQDYLFEHLADFDCFVQPSRYEGFGLTVAEAMAAGLPVLVSNIEGPMEVIDSGRVGLSFETCDFSSSFIILSKSSFSWSPSAFA